MPLIEPTTRSPGRLQIVYSDTFAPIAHAASARFVGEDFPSVATIEATAIDFAETLALLAVSTVHFTGWKVLNNEGEEVLSGSFELPIGGTRGGTDVAYKSGTYTFLGKGTSATLGVVRGLTRTVLYPVGCVEGDFHTPKIDKAGVEPFQTIIDWLNDSEVVGADFYGQKAEYGTLLTTQINAHWQRKVGN